MSDSDSESLSVQFASQIRRLRGGRGWSQAELAAKVTDAGYAIGQTRVSAIELSGRGVTLDQVALFAQVFAVPVSTVLNVQSERFTEWLAAEVVNLRRLSLEMQRSLEQVVAVVGDWNA